MDARDGEAGRDTAEIDRLFLAYLDAAERGEDAENELVERAGPSAPRLAERIRVHRELVTLSLDLGLAKARPQRIGRFDVVRLVGAGGISRVYEAHDPRLGRTVALKVLDRKGLLDRSERAWALNEGRSLARITHRNVARVYDVGEIDDEPYIAMELLPGPSLKEVIERWRRERDGTTVENAPRERTEALAVRYASWSARITLLEALASALAHCHDHGILHRDVKPANVLFDADGEPRLIDFGLAHVEGADEDSRLGLTQALVGTAAYIAPEQVTLDATGADPRSDQFSLGTLGYELFALENPFQRPNRHAILAAVEAADPPPLATRARALPPDLARVIHHALAKAPAERYPDLAAFAADLRAVREHRPISVADPSLAHFARLWLRRHRRRVAIIGTILTVALVLLVGNWAWRTAELRRGVLAELAGIRPDTFTRHEELGRTSRQLLDLQMRARTHDAGLHWSRVSDDVERVVHAWSARLAAFLAEEQARSAETGLALQDATYRQLLWEEERLCPECVDNDTWRAMNEVTFTPGLLEAHTHVFEQLAPLPIVGEALQVFRPIDLVRFPVAGTYRLRLWDEGAETFWGEAVFHVADGWNPSRVIDVQRPLEELRRETLEVQGGSVATSAKRIVVPRFAIMTRLVTRGEYARFLAASGRTDRYLEPAEEPAWVSYDSAFGFAAWAGGRLPTARELRMAEAAGLVLANVPREQAAAELLLDIAMNGDPRWYGYDRHDDDQVVIVRSLRMYAGPHPVGFRLVFSAERVDEYRQASANPLIDPEKQ